MSKPQPIKILFVCHGNICRSTMAHFVMQQMVDEAGLAGRFVIDSAATTTEDLGSPIYPPARAKLRKEGVPLLEHRARQISRREDGTWDQIVCMDEENVRHLRRILGPNPASPVHKLLWFAGKSRDVEDPWWTGDFDATYRDVVEGCTALLEHLTRQ